MPHSSSRVGAMSTVLTTLSTRSMDKKGFAQNTVVFFSSDNGGTRSARNVPLSGIKGSTFEGGIRVPAIVRWPGVLPAGEVSDQVCMTVDFSASIVRIAGAPIAPQRLLDGIDVLKLLEGGKASRPRTLFWRGRRGLRTWRAVRDGDMKYIRREDQGMVDEYLFDLGQDIGKGNNLLEHRPQEVARLKAKLASWEGRVQPIR